MLILGSHVSFKKEDQLLGSVKEAISYGANAIMLYTGAPQNTRRNDLDDSLTKEAYKLLEENNIDINNVIVHAPYIINLANTEKKESYEFSINFLIDEVKRVEQLGLKKIVLHPGSFVNLDLDTGINNIINALNRVFEYKSEVLICLETMAGKGSEIGFDLAHIKRIIDGVNDSNRLLVCLDTCHLNDAGYDMSKFDLFLEEFDKIIGIDKIGCVHVNDSKNNKGDKKDRHENIGYGTLGFNNLINIIYNEKLQSIPKILETPYVSLDDKKRVLAPYKVEIEMIKNKKFNENLYEDIKRYNN